MNINVIIATEDGEVLDTVMIDAAPYDATKASWKIREALEMKFNLRKGDLNYDIGAEDE